MNKEELISEISKKTKVSKKEAGMILSATIDTIQSQVIVGFLPTYFFMFSKSLFFLLKPTVLLQLNHSGRKLVENLDFKLA